MQFNDLLVLNVRCESVAAQTACVFVVSDDDAASMVLADQLGAILPGSTRASATVRVLFGLPILTAPFPILVHSLMTEHNTPLTQLSLFGWIEDNAILEPRAEVFGLTPFGENPVLFLRDLDLDSPPEAYVQTPQPGHWLRIAGIVIAKTKHAQGTPQGTPTPLSGDQAALSALEVVLPPDVQPLVAALRAEVSAGKALRNALRAHRRSIDPALMAICDGWHVLSRAAPFVWMGAAQATDDKALRLFRLNAPRKW